MSHDGEMMPLHSSLGDEQDPCLKKKKKANRSGLTFSFFFHEVRELDETSFTGISKDDNAGITGKDLHSSDPPACLLSDLR